MFGAAGEEFGPVAGARCQLEDIAREGEPVEDTPDMFDLGLPPLVRSGLAVVAAAAFPLLVVLVGPLAVVGELLFEQVYVVDRLHPVSRG